MAISARFRGPASEVDLTRLLNRGLSVLAVCLAAAVLAHVGLLVREMELGGEADSRPLTTRFIQRQPRLTKPMELRKKPKPRRRKMVRQQVQVQARTSRLLTSQVGGISLRSLSAPQVSLDAGAQLVSIDLGGGVTDIGVSTSKEPDNKIDMKEQLLDLNFLDTGKYQAMVIQDPDDKRNIKGYFHIAQAFSAKMVERRVVLFSGNFQYQIVQHPMAMSGLAGAINEYTGIHADFSDRLPLSSRELLDTPWILIPEVLSAFTEGELANLGKYMAGGGFVFCDAGSLDSQADVYLRQMINQSLAIVGRRAEFRRLPRDHPIYHCYFDFDRPPMRLGVVSSTGEGRANADFMVGVELDGRLTAIIAYQALPFAWGSRPRMGVSAPGNELDPTRHLQFGVNIVVFALTQEGSITNRVMETVR